MRKNRRDNVDLKVYSVYEVEGLNQDAFINTLAKKGVFLYNVKKYSDRKMILSVSIKENKKFFAITHNLCYNIKKIRYEGKNYPLYFLLKNSGLFFGALLLVFISFFANGFIFSIEISGSGKIVEREVREYLSEKGIGVFTKFSDLNLSELSDGILASNANLSFVNSKKSGNRLLIELVLSEGEQEKGLGKSEEIRSDYDGIIEELKVYRGTALKKVGDSVKKGELIVGGYAVVKENTVTVNPVAYYSVLSTLTKTYLFDKDNQEDFAYAYALSECGEEEIVSYSIDKSVVGNRFLYDVRLQTRHVVYK